MNRRVPWLVAGLFCVTLATLMLEVLDARLLSVLAWYHLSFLAVSVAMLGMAAGAVIVFVATEHFTAERLPGLTVAFAVVLALSHIASLSIPFPPVRAIWLPDIAALGVATTVLTLPFVLSGLVVTVALTRTGAPIGLMYGADLAGAAAGCLGIIGLLTVTDLSSAAMATAAIAAVGAWCFARAAARRARAMAVVAMMLGAVALVNGHIEHRLGVLFPKNRSVWSLLDTVQIAAWNSHSYVMVRRAEPAKAWMWGPGTHAPEVPAVVAWAMIDGEAGTPITQWDGDPASLSWVQYDVTALPYRLRQGRVGIIGVGGGRDVLTAIAAGNTSITGVEINRTFINLLTGPYRAFAGIADRPGVRLIHDEARSYLVRSAERFDVLQMSLIDTWAATGAGAFTLTENGLYTREAWRVFLNALAPDGVMSVSRWYAPGTISETTRLVSLASAALIDAGIADPSRHVILASAGHVATLLVSRSPFSGEDERRVRDSATRFGFEIQASPWTTAADSRIGRALQAHSIDDLNRAVADPIFDFSPPDDSRPFFFNVLKPRAIFQDVQAMSGGVISGNLVASSTLLALFGVAVLLVVAIIGWPLAHVGKPEMPAGVFGWAVTYFALIGFGFMLVQIPFLQRFSVYLGHPTYTFSIILFLMILAAGGGSVASGRVDIAQPSHLRILVFGIASTIVVETGALQSVMDRTIAWGLPGRTVVVAGFVVPLACALGLWFPIGMRLVNRHSPRATAWMWGVNGACGVLASILAVMVSLWWGIHVNLLIAAGAYALLALPIARLADRR